MTKPPLTRVKQFDIQIGTLQKRVQDLTHEKELAALALVETPADKRAMGILHDADADLVRVRAELEHLQSARNAAARLDAVTERAARLQDLQGLCDSALSIACEERPAVAAKIEALIGKLKPLFEEYAELTVACRRDACKLAIEVQGAEQFQLNAHTVAEPANGNTGGVTDALSGALAAAGVGRIGIRIPGFEQFGDPSRASIVDASRLDGTRVSHRLKALVLTAAQEHFEKDAKVEAETERRMHRLGTGPLPASAYTAAPLPKD